MPHYERTTSRDESRRSIVQKTARVVGSMRFTVESETPDNMLFGMTGQDRQNHLMKTWELHEQIIEAQIRKAAGDDGQD